MKGKNNKNKGLSPVWAFTLTWVICAAIFPMYELSSYFFATLFGGLAAYWSYQHRAKLAKEEQQRKEAEAVKKAAQAAAKEKAQPKRRRKKSYGPEVDAILDEGNKALSEMGRLYMAIDDAELRKKINEIMRITDKIIQDAIHDPADIPQIKKFMNYYLPTTLKLLNSYDRMKSVGIEGENLDKSMNSISEMLDQAIEAYKKRLDSLFANQALDIETDIQVMNTMLEREGLSGERDFKVENNAAQQPQVQTEGGTQVQQMPQ